MEMPLVASPFFLHLIVRKQSEKAVRYPGRMGYSAHLG
jgi:hypothetical protein